MVPFTRLPQRTNHGSRSNKPVNGQQLPNEAPPSTAEKEHDQKNQTGKKESSDGLPLGGDSGPPKHRETPQASDSTSMVKTLVSASAEYIEPALVSNGPAQRLVAREEHENPPSLIGGFLESPSSLLLVEGSPPTYEERPNRYLNLRSQHGTKLILRT